MKSRKTGEKEPMIGRNADIDLADTDSTLNRDTIREKLRSGEWVIEFESEDPDETMH